MKYPKFLKEESTIGITAPSAGIGVYQEEFNQSLKNLKKNNWNLIETSNVRKEGDVSSPPKQRAKELYELFDNQEVDAILCASGGDFLTDMLPYLQKERIKEKWVMGASDPTNLLYYITTACDIATMYGHNAGGFDAEKLYTSQLNAFEFLKGNILPQESFPLYEKNKADRVNGNYALTEKVEWKSSEEEVDVTGRIIGGCIDCLRYLPGTKYDFTKEFINKYKNDGIIWYFDIFSMNTEDFYLTLFQLKEAGWFEHIKSIIVGRILFPSGFTSMTYEKALKETFPNIPIIMEADIGHVVPKMTIINGSIAHITYKKGKGKIEQFLQG
ncbi:MAG: LD-carboxypeptidase [Bacilli bacterium]|nr:LD-carboxypeptidase [Bacilli bacterium]